MADFKKFDYSVFDFESFSANSRFGNDAVNENEKKSASSQPSDIKLQRVKQYIPDKMFITKFVICTVIVGLIILATKELIIFGIELLILIEIFINKLFIDVTGAFSIFGILTNFVNKIRKKIEIKKDIKFNEFFKILLDNNINIRKAIILGYIIVVAFVSILLFNISYFYSYAKDRVETASNYVLYHIDDDKKVGSDEEYSDEPDKKQDEDYENYPDKMSFRLCDNPNNYSIDENLYTIVFPISNDDNIWEYLNSIHGIFTTNYHSRSFSEDIQDLDDGFLEEEELANNYKNKNGKNKIWWKKMPDEVELLAIINVEENFSLTHKNSYVYDRISNNYQKLGLEYVIQKKDKDTAKYYYMKSIEYDFLSIKYSSKTIDYDYNKAVERLYKRYNDIILYCIEDENSNEAKMLYSYINDMGLHIE